MPARTICCSLALMVAFATRAPADLFITIVDGGGTAPGSADGGGSLFAVAEAAAAYWEAALSASTSEPDYDYSISITVKWGDSKGAAGVGGFSVSTTSPPPTPVTFLGYSGIGTITFDDGVSTGTPLTDFWLDPSPLDNSEWSTFTESSADLGGGSMVVGRVFTGPSSGPSGEVDALTVMLHEMGHALGYVDFTTVSSDPYELAVGGDGDIDVDGVGYPHGGAALPITSGHWSSASLGASSMDSSFLLGSRVLLSAADVLGLAEIHGFSASDIDTSPSVVPEPSSLALFAVAAAAAARRWRASRAKSSVARS